MRSHLRRLTRSQHGSTAFNHSVTFSHSRVRLPSRSFARSRWVVAPIFLLLVSTLGCVDSTSQSMMQPEEADLSPRDRDESIVTDLDIEADSFASDVQSTDVLLPDILVIDAVLDAAIDDMQADANHSDEYTTADIDDIFQRGCGSCHNSTASPPLNNGVSAWINRGSGQSPLPLIVPGDHRRSYLYHKLADTHLQPPANGRGTGMPMGRQLYSSEVLARMARWIDNL